MKLMRLDRLVPGDVVLETGVPKIGRATDGPFGHASVALGRLVKIEAADVGSGVVFNRFDFGAFRRGEERLVGVPVGAAADIAVFRKSGLDEGTIRGEALYEAGRRYSLTKLRAFNLKATDRELLERYIARQSDHDDDDEDENESRFCSEVAARILGLPEFNLSPNDLARRPELSQVDDAVVELGADWKPEQVEQAKAVVEAKLQDVRLGLANLVLRELRELADRVGREPASRHSGLKSVEQTIKQEIVASFQALNSIADFESSILAKQTTPIGHGS